MITRPQQIAILTTAAMTTFIVIILCVFGLSWPENQQWPPMPDPYIEMAQVEEYVETVELPPPPTQAGDQSAPALTEENLDNPAETAPQTGQDLNNGPVKAKPAQPVTTNRQSPAKVETKPKTEKTGAPAPDPQALENQATARRTNNQAENAFSKSQSKNNANNANNDTGRAGRKDGNSKSNGPADSKSTTPGINKGRLNGNWSWPALPKTISTDKTGTVVVEFTIAPDGSVTHAVALSGKIPAASDKNLKARCVQYVKSLRFPFKGTKRPDAPAEGNTLTFVFSPSNNSNANN